MKISHPYAWIAMQTYSSRNDDQTIASVIAEILSEAKKYFHTPSEVEAIIKTLYALSESDDKEVLRKLDKLIPRIRRLVSVIAKPDRSFTIFLDDVHVISDELQPKLLAAI